eukprot:scaffold194536_cov47-Prasinocladus_malaysianus.AAC.1
MAISIWLERLTLKEEWFCRFAGLREGSNILGMKEAASELVVFNQPLIAQSRLYNLWCLHIPSLKPCSGTRDACRCVDLCPSADNQTVAPISDLQSCKAHSCLAFVGRKCDQKGNFKIRVSRAEIGQCTTTANSSKGSLGLQNRHQSWARHGATSMAVLIQGYDMSGRQSAHVEGSLP